MISNNRNISIPLIVLIINLSALGFAGIPSSWSGKVVGVSDGDTITVMKQGRGVKIRLAEIDCPEKRQPFGKKAKQYTSDLCFDKIVTVKPTDVDRYGRVVGHAILPDGKILNQELIKTGLAWHYKKYSDSKKFAQLEDDARNAGVGLWSGSGQLPPWEWRRYKRGDSATAKPIANSVVSGSYHGNRKSKVFHNQSCGYYNCKNCAVVFNDKSQAITSGFWPCKICEP